MNAELEELRIAVLCRTCGGGGYLESPSGKMFNCPECEHENRRLRDIMVQRTAMSDAVAAAEPMSELQFLREEVAFLKGCGVVELMVRNPNVASYVEAMEALRFSGTQLPGGFRHYPVRAERLEDALSKLVRHCEQSGVAQVPAGSDRPDLERLQIVIDQAKALLP